MRCVLARNFIIRLGLVLAVWAGPARAANESEETVRDMLVFQDGDRVQGRLVERVGNVLVFQSDRFGELRVPADSVVVIKAQKLSETSAATAAVTEKKAGGETTAPATTPATTPSPSSSGSEGFSTAVLAAKLHDFFGPWHGRLAFAAEVVSDAAERSTLSIEARLNRKWKSDEVQLGGRFDYSETAEITTTDMVKADGSWRHDFGKKGFAQYRPTLEWNRANYRSNVPADYVMLQQEIGVGLNLVAKPGRKLRLGVSENLFDVWNTSPPESHSAGTSESAFLETELRLPWRMTFTDRGIYYYSLSSRNEGWENRAELTKKFSETLSTGIRHEIREGTPNGTVQDYTRLRLLFGLDF
jgi:hypothetical protein